MKNLTTGEKVPATVPGSVYNDLLAAGKIGDPFWRDNEVAAFALMDNDFEYTTSFTATGELLNCDAVLLRCDGLDTLSEITINGISTGNTGNMHRIWEFDVKSILLAGENEISIIFRSPTRYVKSEYDKCRTDGTSDCTVGFPLLRKAHCMFGWDWGPRLPDAGIWRDIYLLGVNSARIDSVYITQHHESGKVRLSLDVQLISVSVDYKPEYTVRITYPCGKTDAIKNEDEIDIENPEIWWPNGFGAQPLYIISVELLYNGDILDTWTRRIGLRTLTIRREKDEFGESFAHEVNGVKIFAMGADYIPEDNILSRITRERTFALIGDCAAANFNCIRVWGGGFYPNDDFFDACDEYGLVVWQDFMFACAVYELTGEFEENITSELIDNIKRIRHHASLGLWCGNNEMEMFVKQRQWVSRDSQVADYIKMYEYIFPKIVKKHDPNTFYWPASPSSGGSFDEPNDENRGDVHYWDVWHGNKPFTEYRKFKFRYLSEFGFQSFPHTRTIESFTLPEDRNIFSQIMERHQRNNAANGKIMNYMAQTFLYPLSFETLVYASQLLQAEAIRYGVEHFRRSRGRCMGTVYWQLNDCWPVASWSSIDYYGRWKALHYYAKRFFAPIAISCEDEGLLTQNPDINAEPYEVKKSIRLNIANETLCDRTLTVKWQLRNNASEIKRSGEYHIFVPALSSAWLERIDMAEAELYSDHFRYELFNESGDEISSGTAIFSMPKHFCFTDPSLSYRLEDNEIIITSKSYAKSVEIQNSNQDLRLSDNYFDMEAGERRIQIISGNPEGLTLRSVWDIGK